MKTWEREKNMTICEPAAIIERSISVGAIELAKRIHEKVLRYTSIDFMKTDLNNENFSLLWQISQGDPLGYFTGIPVQSIIYFNDDQKALLSPLVKSNHLAFPFDLNAVIRTARAYLQQH